MGKVLIVSDTHGSKDRLKDVIKREKPFDLLVHCGDLGFSESDLMVMADTPVYAVAGNTDYCFDLSPMVLFDYSGHKIFVSHGHPYRVDYSLDNITYRAEELGADIVMYGHTHVPCLKEINGITILNPGSLERPRQAGNEPTYMVMETEIDKKCEIVLKKYTF